MGINRTRGRFFDGYWGHCTRIQKIILISLLILSLHSFVVSLGDTKQYAGVDLRNKVVGARYLLAGLDPYAIEWNPPSEWFLDPRRSYPGPSRTTVTPLVLMAYCPLAWLPYPTQRIIWALIEWFTMILCILVLMRIAPRGMARFIFLVFALLFFVSGYFWRLHVERGQYYIFLTFIIIISYLFRHETKKRNCHNFIRFVAYFTSYLPHNNTIIAIYEKMESSWYHGLSLFGNILVKPNWE